MENRRTMTLAALALVAMLLLASCKAAPATSSPTTTATTQAATTTTTAKPATTSAPATTTTAKPTTAPTTAAPAQFGELRIAIATFGKEKFEVPLLVQTDMSLTHPMFDVMIWTEKGQFTPAVLEKWTMSPDTLSWTLNVRKGIKFHNGVEVTAADIKFSLEQYQRKDSPQPMMRNSVERIEVVDNYTVKVTTKGPQPYFPSWLTLGSPQQGGVMPKDYVEKNGWEYANAHPVGTGPWKFVKHNPGDSVQYEAVSSHWRATPNFKNMTIFMIPEEFTRIAALKTGQMEIAESSLDSLAGLKAAGLQTPIVDQVGVGSQFHGAFDPRVAGKPISDLRVRKALQIAINRDEIAKNFFQGLGGPPMPIQSTSTTAEIDADYWAKYFTDMYKYNPDEARRLLKEAGAEGFTIKLYSHPIAGTPWLPQLNEIVAGYWQKVGVNAQVVPVDYGTLLTWRKPLLDQLAGQHTFMRYPSGAPAIRGLESNFGSTGTSPLLIGAPTQPQADKLIAQVWSEIDPAKRRDLLKELITLVHDSFVGSQIGSGPSTLGAAKNIDLSGWSTPPATPVFTMFAANVKHK
ncbi:MAG: ABC transporter substrate-binding protein [Chloroflexi bacterium]|nr:ABC transporter substrate-binding protein [Chloroflexota bacterium]